MPRLLLFTPCENVLISENSNVSLINVMNEVTLTPSERLPDPLPEGAATPMRWFLLSQWEILPEDIGRTFEQRITLSNDQRTPLEGITQFTPEQNKILHRLIARLDHFPLIPSGNYRLKLFLRLAGEQTWQEVSSHPFNVIISQ